MHQSLNDRWLWPVPRQPDGPYDHNPQSLYGVSELANKGCAIWSLNNVQIRSLLLVAILVIAAALAAPSSDSSANATPRKGSITVELVDAELVVANANDESKPALKQALTVGEKIKNEVTVAPNQQISVSFRLRNKATSKPVNVQQAFLTFTNLASGEIIHFVVPADKSKKLYSVNVVRVILC